VKRKLKLSQKKNGKRPKLRKLDTRIIYNELDMELMDFTIEVDYDYSLLEGKHRRKITLDGDFL
jgi:hypothetical protein